MAKTVSQIRLAVRDQLDEPTVSNWTDTRLNVVINQRYQKVYTAQTLVERDYNISVSPVINAVINQQEYQTSDGLPTDIFKIRRVEINYNSSDSVNSANQRAYPLYTIEQVRDRLNNTSIGIASQTYTHPNYYYIGGKLGFIPIPDRAATFQIWYYPILPDLVNDSDTVNIFYPDRYYWPIVLGAAADALRFGQVESTDADKLDAKAEAETAKMQEEMNDRLADEYVGVTDVTAGPLDFGSGY